MDLHCEDDTEYLNNSDVINVSSQYQQQQQQQKGFTWRRLFIVPIILGYFVSLAILLYCVPQYTQLVFREKYNITNTSAKINPCHGKNITPSSSDAYNKVQDETAMWMIYYAVSSCVPAIFMNLVWGSYSDFLGRRFQFILCTGGTFLRVLVFSLVVKYKLDLIYIVISNIIDAASGGFAAMFAVIFAFTADITVEGKQRMGLIIFFEIIIGLIIGAISLASGYLIEFAGYFYPALVTTVLCFISVVISAFFLPETLHVAPSNKPRERNIFKILSLSAKVFCGNETCVRNIKYILLLAAFTLYTIPGIPRGSLEILYQIGKPFCWTPKQVGVFGAVKILGGSFASLCGAFFLHKCLSDDAIAILGSLLCVASFVMEAFVRTDLGLYLVNVLAALTLLPIPMMRSLLSSMTLADKQGALFATIGIVETLSTLLGSLTNNTIYSATLSIMFGFPFLIGAGITFLALVCLVAFFFVQRCIDDLDPALYETLIPEEE